MGSTPEGIQQIKDACRDLDDLILDGLTEEEILTIKYHRQNCKPSYLLKASRKKTKESTKKKQDDFLPTTPIRNEDDTSPKTRLATNSFSPDYGSTSVCVIVITPNIKVQQNYSVLVSMHEPRLFSLQSN